MKKKEIKESEARILVYLSVVHNTRKHVSAISHKLAIDYSYVMRVLAAMVSKGWLVKHKYRRHVFYQLTKLAPLEGAVLSLQGDYLQMDLKLSNYTQEEPGVVYSSSSMRREGEEIDPPVTSEQDQPPDA